MPKPPAISDAEWEVMHVLWEQAPLTASQVIERLSHKPWTAATIKTMLNRLVRKGALRFEENGKHYLYEPKSQREACVRSESKSFLDRVFGGAMGPMLSHFVQNARLSEAEIAELKRLLEKKEK